MYMHQVAGKCYLKINAVFFYSNYSGKWDEVMTWCKVKFRSTCFTVTDDVI